MVQQPFLMFDGLRRAKIVTIPREAGTFRDSPYGWSWAAYPTGAVRSFKSNSIKSGIKKLVLISENDPIAAK
jgi:hypothetical protein